MKPLIHLSITALTLCLFAVCHAAQANESSIVPDGTYLFAERDTCDLYLDIYEPQTDLSADTLKPAVLFVFGGGFINGSRDAEVYLPWYKQLTMHGYKVIAIDYRLGLKGASKVGVGQVKLLDKAIHLAVEDLFSATAFIIENADALGIDPSRIVISGSSAGAITVMQAEYELCNGRTGGILPEDFRYAGVMSFAGAILSTNGKLKYADEPAPTLMMHGTSDKVVNYKQITFFNLGFYGSDKIAASFKKEGYVYNIFRYADNGHEIAEIMDITLPEQIRFMESNVINGDKTVIDATIRDPRIQKTELLSRKDLYGK